MAKTPDEIAAKVKDIYDRARVSDVPISVLSLQITMLLGKGDWGPSDAERVAHAVLDLLAANGWRNPATLSS